jgi:preprotein translocase subunit SecG
MKVMMMMMMTVMMIVVMTELIIVIVVVVLDDDGKEDHDAVFNAKNDLFQQSIFAFRWMLRARTYTFISFIGQPSRHIQSSITNV